MPVNFLSADQLAQYGQFNQPPTLAQLARYFYLDPDDVDWIRRRPESYLRLGLAVQLGTVRFLGTFLEQPLAVPESLIMFVAEQLGITNLIDLALYATSEARFDNKKQIRERFGYQEFSDPLAQFTLIRWLYARAWYAAESPSILFDLGVNCITPQNFGL